MLPHVLCLVLACPFALAAPQRPLREEAAEPLYRAALAGAGGEPAAVLELLASALRAGACPTRTLTESAFGRLHTQARFRELIRAHAHQSRIVVVVPEEPGEPLEVSGTVRGAEGKPVADALVYLFQTDARGTYNSEGMDERNPRIFGYLRTDAQGRYGFRTIRPGHYPDVDEPVEQHIHLEITAPGREAHRTRLGFADDPFWKDRRVPSWAAPVVRGEDEIPRCTLDITLPSEASR